MLLFTLLSLVLMFRLFRCVAFLFCWLVDVVHVAVGVVGSLFVDDLRL